MRRPGITDEEALRVIVDSEVQKRLVASAVELELERRGLPVEEPVDDQDDELENPNTTQETSPPSED
jgi:hypothetical protein